MSATETEEAERLKRKLECIVRVRKWLNQKAKRASDDEEWFDRAEFLLAELGRLCGSVLPDEAALPPPPKKKRGRATSKEEQFLKRVAEGGVEELLFRWLSDHSADVRIDGGAWFHLKPASAELLHVISAEDAGEITGDGLVGWKSYEQVTRCLSAKKRAPVGRGAVAQRICELRDALREAGVNPFLVMTSRRDGVRFALRVRVSSGDDR